MSPRSRTTRTPRPARPPTIHEKILYGLLVLLAFLMPFKFGLINLDVLPNPSFGGPSILSLLYPLQPWATEIAQLLVVLAAFFWILNMIVTRRLVFRYTRADFFLWAFLGLGLLSSFFSVLPHSAMMFMKEFACWALLYHLVVNMPGGKRRERALLAALMAGMVCVSLIGLHQRVVGYEQLHEQVYRTIPAEEQADALALLERGRVMGTFTSPNSLGGLYAMLLPAACLFVLVVRQWTRARGAAPAVLYAVFGPLLAFAVFILTESKGAFLSVGILAIVVIVVMRRRLKVVAWKLLVLLAVAATAAVVVSTTEPGRKLIERGSHTFKERIGYWRGAARIAADRPFARNAIGSGFNAFSALFAKYKDPPQAVGMARSAHNNYVQLFIEVGALGLAAFVAFWIAHLARAGPIVRAFARGTEQLTFAALLVLAAFFGLLAFLLHSIVDFDLYVPGLAMTAMFLVALMARHTAPLREKTAVLRKEIHAVCVLAGLMLVTGPLMLFVPMPMTSEIHYFNAHAILAGTMKPPPPDPPAAAIEEMRRALQWDRLNHNYVGFLAMIYYRRGTETGDRADLADAISLYERALRLHRNSYRFRYRLAVARLERMRLDRDVKWDVVLDEIRQAVALFPTNSFMRLRYVYYLDQAGRTDEAKQHFDTAERLDPADFSLALQTASQTYNEFDFKTELERLRAKYGTPQAPPEDAAEPPPEQDPGE